MVDRKRATTRFFTATQERTSAPQGLPRSGPEPSRRVATLRRRSLRQACSRLTWELAVESGRRGIPAAQRCSRATACKVEYFYPSAERTSPIETLASAGLHRRQRDPPARSSSERAAEVASRRDRFALRFTRLHSDRRGRVGTRFFTSSATTAPGMYIGRSSLVVNNDGLHGMSGERGRRDRARQLGMHKHHRSPTSTTAAATVWRSPGPDPASGNCRFRRSDFPQAAAKR